MRVMPEHILNKGRKLVTGSRAKAYGDFQRNHQHIANMWTAFLEDQLKTPLTAAQVAYMMSQLKMARSRTGVNPDNAIDAATYAAIGGACEQGE